MIVVDTTVRLSRSLPQDEFHERSRRWLITHTAVAGRIVAPLLLPAEVAGAVPRRTDDSLLVHRVVETLLRLPSLRLVPLDPRLGRR